MKKIKFEDLEVIQENDKPKKSLSSGNQVIGILILLFIFFVLKPLIINYKKQQWQEEKAEFNQAIQYKYQQEQSIKLQRHHSSVLLKHRMLDLSHQLSHMYIYTTSDRPIQAYLHPNHPAAFLDNYDQTYYKDIYGDNPVEDFLNKDNNYGYSIYLNRIGDQSSFGQFRYFPQDKNKKNPKSEKTKTSLVITRLSTISDKEIDEFAKKNFITKEAAISHIPSYKDHYYSKQIVLTDFELNHPKSHQESFSLIHNSFDRDDSIYIISSYNPELSPKQQDVLIKTFIKNFNIPKTAFEHFKWREIKFAQEDKLTEENIK